MDIPHLQTLIGGKRKNFREIGKQMERQEISNPRFFSA
jgi:hypothetical protein